jgi:RNA polymerase sigma factor (TIGR02999 family)
LFISNRVLDSGAGLRGNGTLNSSGFLAIRGAGGYTGVHRTLSPAVEPPLSEVTRILSAIEQGDPHAAEQLLPLVYHELRQLAAQRLAQEKPGQTLQATALVHEAYLRLVDTDQAQHWDSRGHFFAAAAEAMRRVLIDNARRKQADKHGGGWQRHELLEAELAIDSTSGDLFAVDDALSRLGAREPVIARLVELRFFAGLSLPEAAKCLGISERTAYRHWAYARAWLRRDLDRSGEGNSKP